jgi:hypothetical protein
VAHTLATIVYASLSVAPRPSRGMADAGRHRPQPHPRRWLPSWPVSCPPPYWHYPPPPGHPTRPDRLTIPPHHPPVTDHLATSRRLRRFVHRHPRPVTPKLSSTNTRLHQARPVTTVEKLGTPAVSARPQPHTMIRNARRNQNDGITQSQAVDPGLDWSGRGVGQGICQPC